MLIIIIIIIIMMIMSCHHVLSHDHYDMMYIWSLPSNSSWSNGHHQHDNIIRSGAQETMAAWSVTNRQVKLEKW